MCDPLTISLALTGGSVISNALAQGQDARAREDALEGERYRQAQLARESDALNDQSRQGFDNLGAEQDQRSSELAQYFTTAPESANTAVDKANASAASVMPSATNDIVQREIQKQGDAAKAFTGQQGEALGGLRAFGDVLGRASLDQARNAGYVGQVNGFRQGSTNVLPYELEDANKAGDGLRFFGDVLGLAGSAVAPMQPGGLGSLFGGGGAAIGRSAMKFVPGAGAVAGAL